ncbi:MAG: hypothetical protein ACO3LZ_00515 [Candidatus Nanopelagicales bacterium]
MSYVRGWITKPRRTFVLGVGAQKAGTTWLFQYLRQVRHCRMPGHKEFHVWDVLDLPYAAELRVPEVPRHDHDARVAEMVADPQKYFDFFAAQLTGSRITGDITPSYAGLSVERLRAVDSEFAKLGITVKSIFLMRDPVARCVSAFRWRQRRGGYKLGLHVEGDALDDAFVRFALSCGSRVRTHYEMTWRTNEQALGEDRVHVELYERLFTERALTRLDAFLGSHGPHRLSGQRYNASEHTRLWNPSEDARRHVARAYRETYNYIAARRPDAIGAWGSYALLGD